MQTGRIEDVSGVLGRPAFDQPGWVETTVGPMVADVEVPVARAAEVVGERQEVTELGAALAFIQLTPCDVG